MAKPTKTVYLVGHKDSAKKKDYLAITPDYRQAALLLRTMEGATFIKEVEYEGR